MKTRGGPAAVAAGLLCLALVACSKSTPTLTPTMAGSPPVVPNGASKVVPIPIPLPSQKGQGTKEVSLVQGDTLVVLAETNASTGYEWTLTTKPDPAVLDFAGKQLRPPASPMPGAAGQHVFTFSSVGAGQATLVLTYARPFGNEGAFWTQTVDVTVS